MRPSTLGFGPGTRVSISTGALSLAFSFFCSLLFFFCSMSGRKCVMSISYTSSGMRALIFVSISTPFLRRNSSIVVEPTFSSCMTLLNFFGISSNDGYIFLSLCYRVVVACVYQSSNSARSTARRWSTVSSSRSARAMSSSRGMRSTLFAVAQPRFFRASITHSSTSSLNSSR